jgi:ribonuclease VapC
VIIDASAILAILLEEAEGVPFKHFVAEHPGPHEISPMNYLEAAVRLDRLRLPAKLAELDPLMNTLEIQVSTTTPDQAKLAREAYFRFGKGNHKAQLNLGDCFAYALAKARSEPLLFKGNDFRLTDVEAAL